MVRNKIVLLGLAFGLIGTACESPEGISQKEVIKEALNNYYRGEEFEKQRELEKAEHAYLVSLETSPRPRVWYRLAEVERALGKIGQAKYAANSALRMVPDYTEAKLLNTELESQYPDIEPEMPVSELPLDVEYDDATGEEKVESIERLREENIIPDEDVVAVQTGTKIEDLPAADQEKYQEAMALSQAGNWQASAESLQDLSTQYPDAPEILYQYGYALFNLNQVEMAAQLFEKSIELDSTNANVFNDLGVAYQRLGQPSDAVEAYEKAIMIGRHVDAYYNLALIKEKLGEYKAAIRLYQEYLKYDSVSRYADIARDRIDKLRRSAY